MSDWAATPVPNPTLIIDFIWKRQPTAYCGNCSEVVNIDARSHWGGCGIVYEYVSTRAYGAAWQKAVKDRRQDLVWSKTLENPKQEAEFLKDQPIRPLFAWERGVPTGEGSSGEYVRHLRENRKQGTVAVDPGRTKTGIALDFGGDTLFSQQSRWHTTSLRDLIMTHMHKKKEDPMPEITVTITGKSIEDIAALLLDMSAYEDIGVRVYKRLEVVTPTPEEQEVVHPVSTLNRVRYDLSASILKYLLMVCDHNKTAQDNPIQVVVEYVSAKNEMRSTRTITPLSIPGGRGGDKLVLLDQTSGGGVKTFSIDRIKSVEGPANF